MSYQELQTHKKSDSIKWIIAFALIAILSVGMIVSFVKDRKENPTEEKKIEYSDDGATAKFDDGFEQIIFEE